MTRVRFYHNAPDPFALACELITSAYRRGRKAAVRLPDAAALRTFDELLWSREQRAFVPHVPAGSALAGETPIVLDIASSTPRWPHADLIFNLAPDVPPDAGQFRVVIEIVGQDDAHRLPARARWQQYKAAGLALEAFDAIRREAL